MASQAKQPQRQVKRKKSWEKEFYKNGIPTEVIVISDSPTPTPPPSLPASSSSSSSHEYVYTTSAKKPYYITEPEHKRQKTNTMINQSKLLYRHLFGGFYVTKKGSIGILAFHLFPNNPLYPPPPPLAQHKHLPVVQQQKSKVNVAEVTRMFCFFELIWKQ
jgi:hypothetical protein